MKKNEYQICYLADKKCKHAVIMEGETPEDAQFICTATALADCPIEQEIRRNFGLEEVLS